MKPMRSRVAGLSVTVAMLLAASAAISAGSASASLGGEELTAPSAALKAEPTGGEPYCGATQQGSVTFSTSGAATGPYPGTFTETGHWSFDLVTEQTFSASFTIKSGKHTISGITSYDQEGTGPEGTSLIQNWGGCAWSQSGGPYSTCTNEEFAGTCYGQSVAYIYPESFRQSFAAAPKVTSVTPTAAVTGSSVTITGSSLSLVNQVKFGTLATHFTVVSGTEIQATVPNGAKVGRITLGSVLGIAKSPTNFTPTLSVVSVNYNAAAPGLVIKIKGLGFTHTSAVVFNGTPAAAVTYVSASELKATVPLVAGTGPLTVTNSEAPVGTATAVNLFQVL